MLQVVRCGSEEPQLGFIRLRRCSQRIVPLMADDSHEHMRVYGAVVCSSPLFLASGFHHLLHVSHMNVVVCFSCKYA